MSDTRISEFGDMVPNGTEFVPLARGGANGKATSALILRRAPRAAPLWRPGSWLLPDVATIASNVVATNTLYLSPIDINPPPGQTFSLRAVAVQTQAAVAGNVRIGVYRVDHATSSLTFLQEGTAAGNTNVTGLIALDLAADIVVEEPTLLICATLYSAGANMRSWTTAGAAGGGMARWIAVETPGTALIANTTGFGRATAGTVTYAAPPTPVFPSSIAWTSVETASASPGSPIVAIQRAP